MHESKKKCPSTLLCMLASSHRFSKGSSHLNQDHQDQSTQLQKEVYPSCALSLPHVSSKRSSLEFIHVIVFENQFKSLILQPCERSELNLCVNVRAKNQMLIFAKSEQMAFIEHFDDFNDYLRFSQDGIIHSFDTFNTILDKMRHFGLLFNHCVHMFQNHHFLLSTQAF